MKIIRQYRNRPKIINAFQYNGESIEELGLSKSLIEKWKPEKVFNKNKNRYELIFINKYHNAKYFVDEGDYLAWQNLDDPYPVKKHVFDESYCVIADIEL